MDDNEDHDEWLRTKKRKFHRPAAPVVAATAVGITDGDDCPSGTEDETTYVKTKYHPELAAMGLVRTAQQLNSTKQNKRRATMARLDKAARPHVEARTASIRTNAGMQSAEIAPKRIVSAVQEWWDTRRATISAQQGQSVTGDLVSEVPQRAYSTDNGATTVPLGAVHTEVTEVTEVVEPAEAAASATPKPTRTRNLANERLQNEKRARVRAEGKARCAAKATFTKSYRLTSKTTGEQAARMGVHRWPATAID